MYTTTEDPKELAYDLRQIYAKLVGEHLIDAAEARKSNNFYVWFKALEDIHTIVMHKFKHKKEDEKSYNAAKEKVAKLANQYPSSWLSTAGSNIEVSLIEDALRHLEEFLYNKMSEAKMFGESGRIAGL